MIRYGLYLLCMVLASCHSSNENTLQQIIDNDPTLKSIITNPTHEVQILYTQIDRDSANKPIFTTYSIGEEQYFYPASTVKFPIALFALEKLNELNIQVLDMHTVMLTDSAYSGQSSVIYDSTSSTGMPSIAHYIKKIFVTSDNDAYNRLYEFLGADDINRRLKVKGLLNSRINHRLSIALSWEENMHTNPIRFLSADSLVYEQPLKHNDFVHNPEQRILKGKGYIDGNEALVNEPFDFTIKNEFNLRDQQELLKMILFDELLGSLNLNEQQRLFALKYMSQLPRETKYPDYASEQLPDAWCKFLMFDPSDTIPNHIRIFNKIGQAYGYLIDNAYIIDLENNVEFLLSAVIHVNDNETYNDGIYEYDSIGFPFMKALGQEVYQFELNRPKKYEPDLSSFVFEYGDDKRH